MRLCLAAAAQAIEAAWDEGCPVARRSDEIARVAVRRWRSMARRGILQEDFQAGVRDLADGLVARFERSPKLVGPLKGDYEFLAEKIAQALGSDAGLQS